MDMPGRDIRAENLFRERPNPLDATAGCAEMTHDFAYFDRQHLIHEPPFSERKWYERTMIRIWTWLGMIKTPDRQVLRRFG